MDRVRTIIAAALGVAIAAALAAPTLFADHATAAPIAEAAPCVTPHYDGPLDVDPPPATQLDASKLRSSKDRARMNLVGRIAEGIYKKRTMKGRIPYWFCGEPYEGEEAKTLAAQVAWHVVRSAEEASDDRRTLNVWGWAGLLNNEGGMDLCTLGLYPRRKAYDLGVLERRRRTVSHTKADVLRAIRHPKMKGLFRAFDLGMGQTLDSHYRAHLAFTEEPGGPEDLLEWSGFYWQAQYLHGLAIRYGTDRPWLYWPGYRAAWKDFRVTQHALSLGATREEIGRVTPGDWKKPPREEP